MNVLAETVKTLREAAELFPGKPDTSTLSRWAEDGCRSKSGKKVFLDHAWVGARIFTSAEAVQRFLLVLNAPKKSNKPRREPVMA